MPTSREIRVAEIRQVLEALPRRETVLDVGARDGYFSKILLEYYSHVTALDLERPSWEHPGITTVKGDVSALAFPDNSFDTVLCTEVLEHVPAIESACRELMRVARHEVIISVPYRQDIRVGRTTCRACGGISPPYGHVNSFDENRLRTLFAGANILDQKLFGQNRVATNLFSMSLMDLAGNPWGTYHQGEPCIHCHADLIPPASRPLWSRACSAIALSVQHFQTALTPLHANWIYLVMAKSVPSSATRKHVLDAPVSSQPRAEEDGEHSRVHRDSATRESK